VRTTATMLRWPTLLVAFSACSAGKLSVNTGNLASKDSYSTFDTGFDTVIGGIKATFDRVVKLGSEDVKLSAEYEADDLMNLHSPANIKEVSASGTFALDGASPSWTTHADGHPFKLGYSLAHKLKDGVTALKLSASTYGASLKGKADSKGAAALESVSYGYGVKAGGTDITIDNEFELHGKWGADSIYKLSLGFYGVTTSVSQPFSSVMPDLEVATSHAVADGRTLASSVTVGPQSSGGVYSDAKLTYSDKKLQEGATWEASASQPLTKLSGSKLTVKRSWSF